MEEDNRLVVSQSQDDFNRARMKAMLSEVQHFMNIDKDNLLSFNDVKSILNPKSEVYRGMQIVPIKLIVGSEGRYRDFNNSFLPRKDFLRSRWESVDQARLKDITLPPIQLYEIGGAYFVRDGNHRVSVAKTQGVESIDADVTTLSSEIVITPGMTVSELKERVIDYEKRIFYEKTRFGELTGDNNLDFSAPGQYDVIYNHILVHKYYINQGIPTEIAFSDALISWYRNVYNPIMQAIHQEWIELNFPGSKPGDLYVWLVKHWDFLKKQYGMHYSLICAARDFTVKYGQSRGRFFRFIAALVDRWLHKIAKQFHHIKPNDQP
ncbi:MAG: transcriptional regulator [Spirochaetaceae bacterium]|nr:transcriptional regulator [Spirochaetaceae bacterium]